MSARRVAEEMGLKRAAWRGTAAVGERRVAAVPAWWKVGARHCPAVAVRRWAEAAAARSPARAPVARAVIRRVGAEVMPPVAEGRQQVQAEVVQRPAVRAAVLNEKVAAVPQEKVVTEQRMVATEEGWKKRKTCH